MKKISTEIKKIWLEYGKNIALMYQIDLDKNVQTETKNS
jgi:hypothetical protein